MRGQHGTRRARTGAALVTAVLAALLQLVGIVGAPPAWACPASTEAMHLKSADAVFTGRVISWARWPNGTTITALLRVSRIYKGAVGESAYVVTDTSSTYVGYGVGYGTAWWLVFAYDRGRAGLHAIGCSSRPLPTQLPAVLGAGHAPLSDPAAVVEEPELGPGVVPPGWDPLWRDGPLEHRGVGPDIAAPMPIVEAPGPTPWLAGGGAGLLLLAMPTWLALRMRRLRPLYTEPADEARIRWVG